MLGSSRIRELLPVEQLLQGRNARLKKPEVSELLLIAARIAIDLECHSRLENQATA